MIRDILFTQIDGAEKRQCIKAVQRCRWRLLNDYPYYGSIAMGFDVVVCNNWNGRGVETAATDGRHLFVNPQYFLDLTFDEQLSLVVHEVSHKALAHHLRRGGRNHDLWNAATDHAVNHQILDAGMKIGEGWYCDYKYKGWSSERIYGRVEEEFKPPPPPPPPPGGKPPPPGGNEPPPPGGGGERPEKQPGEVWDATDKDGKELTEEGKHKAMRDLTVDVHMANEASRTAGNDGSALHKRSVNEILAPSADWANLLSEFWSGTGTPINETWSRPNRRYMPAGIWAPSIHEGGIDWGVIGMDVSGSIMQRECDAFIAMINQLRTEVPARRITIVPFNSVIQKDDIVEIYDGDDVPNRFNVGGGTNFKSITNWVKRQTEDPDFLIIFTDLCCSSYGPKPSCPTLWASSDPVYDSDSYSNRPPFGDVIEVEVPGPRWY